MWKRLCILLLVFSLVVLPCYSDVILSEEEYQAVMTALETSETALEKQEKSINNLETQLNQLKNLQEISSKIIQTQGTALEQHEKYLKEQRKDHAIKQVERFLQGALTAGIIYFIIK